MASILSSWHDPKLNHLLAAFPAEVFDRISPHLEFVSMPLGEVLCEPGKQLQNAYFPTTSIVSLHYITENGSSAEISGVGNEGMIGVPLFMGGHITPSRATVCIGGHGYQLKARPFECGQLI